MINVLLTDDDKDDCLLFKEALESLELQTSLTIVHNGEELMELLAENSGKPFDVLFLDLNMPRKNGFTSLVEIQNDTRFSNLPVIIISTSYDESSADRLYNSGAKYYISKPVDFSLFRKVIRRALELIVANNVAQPAREKFLLNNSKTILE